MYCKCKCKQTNDIGHKFLLENYEVTSPVLIMTYRIAITCDYASARVECLFSSITYIDAKEGDMRYGNSLRENGLENKNHDYWIY